MTRFRVTMASLVVLNVGLAFLAGGFLGAYHAMWAAASMWLFCWGGFRGRVRCGGEPETGCGGRDER